MLVGRLREDRGRPAAAGARADARPDGGRRVRRHRAGPPGLLRRRGPDARAAARPGASRSWVPSCRSASAGWSTPTRTALDDRGPRPARRRASRRRHAQGRAGRCLARARAHALGGPDHRPCRGAAARGSASDIFIDNIHRAGEVCRERGFDPVLHFHAGSYCESSSEIHAVFDALDTSLVGMCLDTGHALFGGADPLELLATYGDIVRHVHVKDCDLGVLRDVCRSGGGLMEAWDRGVFCQLGLGTADLDGFLRGAPGARLRGLGGRRAGPLPEAGRHARGAPGPAHGQPRVARRAGLLSARRAREGPRPGPGAFDIAASGPDAGACGPADAGSACRGWRGSRPRRPRCPPGRSAMRTPISVRTSVVSCVGDRVEDGSEGIRAAVHLGQEVVADDGHEVARRLRLEIVLEHEPAVLGDDRLRGAEPGDVDGVALQRAGHLGTARRQQLELRGRPGDAVGCLPAHHGRAGWTRSPAAGRSAAHPGRPPGRSWRRGRAARRCRVGRPRRSCPGRR